MSRYDRDVYRAIKGRTEATPADVADVLGLVDAFQRLVLTVSELNQSLERLIGSGRVKEVAPGLYAEGNDPSRTFHPISESAHEAAYELYGKRLRVAAYDPESDLSEVVLRVRWRLPDGAYADEATEQEIERLAGRLDEALEGRAEGLGFEFGPGLVDLVLAVREGSDAEEVVEAAQSILDAWPAPPGSSVVLGETSPTALELPAVPIPEIERETGPRFEEGPMFPGNPDWILVVGGSEDEIEEAARSYFSLSEPEIPVTTTVSLAPLPGGRWSLRFEPRLPPYAFTNLVNWLDDGEVLSSDGAIGWLTASSGVRYVLQTDLDNPDRDTALALSSRGESFEVYLPETTLRRRSARVRSVREPLVPETGHPSRRFQVVVEADPSFGNPGFAVTG
jgi:hypothetical protein